MENKKEQMLLAGVEELIKRKNYIYSLKRCMNINFGLFKNWSEEVDEHYKNKYPLIAKES